MQCQSQLKTLYAEGIKGCDMEFAAYNLLCVLLHSSNNRDLLLALSRSVTYSLYWFSCILFCGSFASLVMLLIFMLPFYSVI